MIAYEVPTTCAVPYLVSFPRTGSHWLRSFLELYFDRPLLTRSFYRHESTDFLLLHSHDLGADRVRERRDTIYLYRSIVSTVFSQLTYDHGPEAPNLSAAQVLEVAEQYRKHLRAWLLGGNEGLRLHVVAYEWLLDRPAEVLAGVIEFLGGEPEKDRIMRIWPTITHESVRERSTYEPRVISTSPDTHLRRELFRYRWGDPIIAHFRVDRELTEVLDPRLIS